MGVDYGWEKFFNALHYVVASTAGLQERLAVVSNGVCHLERDSFPDDETYERFQKLIKGTTMLPAKANEGTIAATTSQMEEAEAKLWLQEALGIFSDIAEAYGKQSQQAGA